MMLANDPMDWEEYGIVEKNDFVENKENKENKGNKGNNIIMIGSSIIALWPADLLNKTFPQSNYIMNKGVSGCQLSDCINWLKDQIGSLTPNVIVFYAGSNDIGNGASYIDVANRFRSWLSRVRSFAPNALIICIGLIVSPSKIYHKIAGTTLAANKELRNICNSSACVKFIDTNVRGLFYSTVDGSLRADLFVSDGLHLTDQGYEVLGSAIRG